MNGMGLGRDASLPSEVWGEAPRFFLIPCKKSPYPVAHPSKGVLIKRGIILVILCLILFVPPYRFIVLDSPQVSPSDAVVDRSDHPDAHATAQPVSRGLAPLSRAASPPSGQNGWEGDGFILATAVHPGGRWLATGGDQRIRLWDRSDHPHLHRAWRASTGWIRALAFSPDGLWLASAGQAGHIHLWNWQKAEAVRRWSGQGGAVHALAFSPSGTYLATGSEDHRVRLWEVATGRLFQTLTGHSDGVRGVAFGVDDATLVSVAADGGANLWHREPSLVRRPLRGARQGLYAVAFSPDGRRIAAGSYRTVLLWDAQTGRYKPPLKQHDAWVRSVAFNPEGTLLASATDSGTVRLWHMRTGRPLESWKGHQESVFSVNFIEADVWMSAAGDGTARIWRQGHRAPEWTLTGGGEDRWRACRTRDQRCWGHGSADGVGLTDRVTASSTFFVLDHTLPSWGVNVVIGLTGLTFLALIWIVVVRPLTNSQSAVARLLFPFLRRFHIHLYPPSPSRFARRVGASLDFSLTNNKHAACIRLTDTCPLAVTRFFYVQVTADHTEEWLAVLAGQALRHPNRPDTAPVFLLVGVDDRQVNRLRALDRTPDCLWVIPDTGEVTRLLLAAQPGHALARLLATHLAPIHVTPYQPHTPVLREKLFFGRRPLLEKLLHRTLRNQLIIGGQQMGKTSLLHAIMRTYRKHPLIRCSLYAPEEAQTLTYIRQHAVWEKESRFIRPPSLEKVLDTMTRPFSLHHMGSANRKQQVMLIDDADALLVADTETLFSTLNRLRRLNEEGVCHVILTASWPAQRLLQSDHGERLSELVEIHHLGAMEPVAGWNLARTPMAWIHRQWESKVCQQVIQASSSRPDWIVALCHEVLRQLKPTDFTITQGHWEAALSSPEVERMFEQWPSLLSSNTEARQQDQWLVFVTVSLDHFTAAELLTMLKKKQGACLTDVFPTTTGRSVASQLREVLDRLEMACILRKTDAYYYYPSKQLCTKILRQHPEERLKRFTWKVAVQPSEQVEKHSGQATPHKGKGSS